MKKSKRDSGKGSENISSVLTDCKREKYIDSTFTSPTLHLFLVTPAQEGFWKTRKATKKDKKDACKCVPASRYIRRINIRGHAEKMCLMIEMTEKTMSIHHLSYQRTNEHAVKLSASQLKREVFFPYNTFAFCKIWQVWFWVFLGLKKRLQTNPWGLGRWWLWHGVAGVQCLAPEVPSCQLPKGRWGYNRKEHLTLRLIFILLPLNTSLLVRGRERVLGWQTSSHIHMVAYVHAREQTFNSVYLCVIPARGGAAEGGHLHLDKWLACQRQPCMLPTYCQYKSFRVSSGWRRAHHPIPDQGWSPHPLIFSKDACQRLSPQKDVMATASKAAEGGLPSSKDLCFGSGLAQPPSSGVTPGEVSTSIFQLPTEQQQKQPRTQQSSPPPS